VATNFQKVLERNELERDQIKSADESGQFRIRADEKIRKLDPGAPDHAERVKELVTGERQTALDRHGSRNPRVRAAFAASLANDGAALEITAAGLRRGHLELRATQVHEREALRTYEAIRKDPGGTADYIAAFNATANQLYDGMSADARLKAAKAFGEGALEAAVQGYSENGDFQGASKFVDDNQKSMTPEKFQALKGRIRTGRDQARSDGERGRALYVGQIEVDILKGEDAARNGGGYNGPTADKVLSDPNLTPQHQAHLMRMIRQAQQIGNADREARTQALAVVSSRVGVRDRAQADLAEDTLLEFKKKQLGPSPLTDENVADIIVRVVRDGGMMTTRALRAIQGADNVGGGPTDSGAAAKLAAAAALWQRIEKEAPSAKGIELKEDSRVAQVLQLLRDGGASDLKDAATRVAAWSPTDLTTRKQRGDQYPETVKALGGTKREDLLNDIVPGWFARNLGGAPSAPAFVPPEVYSEFDRVRKAQFLLSGDLKNADGVAKKWIAANYDLTTVGGRTHVVRHPPEKIFFSDADLSQIPFASRAAVVNEILVNHPNMKGYLPPTDPGWRGVIDPANLLPTDLSFGFLPPTDLGFRLVPTSASIEALRGAVNPAQVSLSYRVQVRLPGAGPDAPYLDVPTRPRDPGDPGPPPTENYWTITSADVAKYAKDTPTYLRVRAANVAAEDAYRARVANAAARPPRANPRSPGG